MIMKLTRGQRVIIIDSPSLIAFIRTWHGCVGTIARPWVPEIKLVGVRYGKNLGYFALSELVPLPKRATRAQIKALRDILGLNGEV